MAHNFKLTGDYYVSVDGSDSNDGLTKDTPKRTVQAGLNLMTVSNRILIIGSGVYKESLSRTVTVSGVVVSGDGHVIITGRSITLNVQTNIGSNITFNNISFKDYSTFSIVCGNSCRADFNNCELINSALTGAIVGGTGSSTLINCKILYTSIVTTGHPFTYNKCIVIASPLTANNIGSITNSYIDAVITRLATLNHNNITNKSPIIMNVATTLTSDTPVQDVYGRWYNPLNAGSGGDGTVGDPYGRALTAGAGFDFATHRILYPSTNANSFSLDPKFNDIEAQDFTLQADSPHLGKASDSTNIGGTSYALRYAALGNTFNANATVVDLEQRGEDWIVDLPATSGSVVSAPIFVNNVPKVLQRIRYNGRLEFNKAVTPPVSGSNVNVPDNFTYDSTTQPPDVAGANPDRLVYEMRFSTQVAEPTTSGEWDNDGLWTAGDYGVFEWNAKPSVDTLGIGNGNPTFNIADTPTFLQATWIQLRIILRNDYGA
jgi:hypothetical protein